MRVFLHYEEGDDEAHHMTLKLTLPSKWKTGPTEKLKETFVEHYNKKHRRHGDAAKRQEAVDEKQRQKFELPNNQWCVSMVVGLTYSAI